MVKYVNQLVKIVFLLILVARISVSEHGFNTRAMKNPSNTQSKANSNGSPLTKNKSQAGPNVASTQPSISAPTMSSTTTTTTATKTNSNQTVTSSQNLRGELNKEPPFCKELNVACGIAIGGGTLFIVLLFISIFVLKYHRWKRIVTVEAELRRVSVRPTTLTRPTTPTCPVTPTCPSSPVYCEVDSFRFPSSESRSETENIETEAPNTDSEDEYSYPDAYEIINGRNPPQSSGVYSIAYDHIIVNADYVNCSPIMQRSTHGENPHNKDKYSSDDSYEYAYDHRGTFGACFAETCITSAHAQEYVCKDDVDDGEVYENYPAVLEQENETETAPLEYINVL